jgi:CDP-diacylglycerol--glycerol-3-phosphate 3-phosphatidyltransferase
MLNLPNAVSCLRLALVPLLIALAWRQQSNAFLFALVISFLTDIADGLLARWLKRTTELGAKLDSWGDFATYAALPFCGWWLQPETLRHEVLWLGIGIFSYVAAVAAGFLKFGRLTSYHTWSGKIAAWIVGGAILLFFASGSGWPLRVAMPIVILTSLEEIIITMALPNSQANVPSLWHALKRRHIGVPVQSEQPVSTRALKD